MASADRTSTSTKGKRGRSKGTSEMGEVAYPEVSVRKATASDPDGPITVDQAKELLGWQEEGMNGAGTFGKECLLIDRNKKKIRCINNVKNRPLYMSKVEELVQEHLMKRWRYNGEPIIIGRTRQILNGQHSLISLILAEQDRIGHQKHIWQSYWDGPVTMEKLIVYGVDERDEVINTMDTCKPRSLTDVLYRMPFFAKQNPKERKSSSRCLGSAVKLLWVRTGANKEGLSIATLRTHAESLDWIDRHPHILQCVSHIMDKCSTGLGKMIAPGYAAGLLYLMGCSSSDGKLYRSVDPMREMMDKDTPLLDWANWGAACDYWVEVATGSDEGDGGTVRMAIGNLDSSRTGGSVAERLAVLVQGWNVYAQGNKVLPSDLQLHYPEDKDGVPQGLDYTPEVGGIDLGDPRDKDEDEIVDTREEDEADELDEEQIEERNLINEENLAKKQYGRKAYAAMSEVEKAQAREEQRERMAKARNERHAAPIGGNGENEEEDEHEETHMDTYHTPEREVHSPVIEEHPVSDG